MKIGTLELVIILAVVIIIFGPTQIPKLTKMFGKSVKNFKEGLEETEEEAPESEAPKKAKKAKSSSAAPKKDADASDEQEYAEGKHKKRRWQHEPFRAPEGIAQPGAGLCGFAAGGVFCVPVLRFPLCQSPDRSG